MKTRRDVNHITTASSPSLVTLRPCPLTWLAMSSETPTKKSYKDTLNLPQPAFPMEAKLTANEPARLARWQQMGLYEKIQAARANAKKWVLHDGPPFANGDIHLGHVINK